VVEVCTARKILGKRKNAQNRDEYLVSWVEYPNEDTWESPENLQNVQPLITEYEVEADKEK
jgi:hypothetical protein